MPRFVVAGASGFIGSAVCRELERRGLSFARLRRDSPIPNDPSAICIHLAGESRAGEYERPDSILAEEDLKLAIRLSEMYKYIVFGSSALVYGPMVTEDPVLFSESDQVTPPNRYARSKQTLEALFLRSEHAVVRLANVYGPGMSGVNVFSDIMAQLKKPEPLALRDLRPVRDYVWIDDVAIGLVDIALAGVSGVYNLGTGIGTSVGEVAREFLIADGQHSREVIGKDERRPVNRLVIDSSKLESSVGWKPIVDLACGVRKLIDSRRE